MPTSSLLVPNSRLNQFIQMEHQKAIDEIKMRIEQDNAWFQYKFILLGALLFGFVAKAIKDGDMPGPQLVQTLLYSEVTCCILAVAVIIAIATDIHIRNNVLITNQLGIWIKYYVEDSVGQSPPDIYFWGWESFLRDPGALHSDSWTGLFFWPNNHFLTLFVFLLFIIVFQNSAFSTQPALPHHKWLLWGVFASTAITLFILTMVTHSCPPLFQYNDPGILAWGREATDGRVGFCYIISWLLIVIINFPPLLHQRNNDPAGALSPPPSAPPDGAHRVGQRPAQ